MTAGSLTDAQQRLLVAMLDCELETFRVKGPQICTAIHLFYNIKPLLVSRINRNEWSLTEYGREIARQCKRYVPAEKKETKTQRIERLYREAIGK